MADKTAAARAAPAARPAPPAAGAPADARDNMRDADWIQLLENLGRIPAGFDGDALLQPLKSKNQNARKLAAINMGKLAEARHLPALLDIAQNDNSTAVRREAAAAIGRMKNRANIPALIKLTGDKDPKVILQALRGLLHYPKNKAINEALEILKRHPNEMIREIIKRERTYFGDEEDGHAQSPDFMKNVVVNGDALEVLGAAPRGCVHLTFTSPPYYNARDYSIYASYGDYLKFLEKVFRQVHRVTKPGRFFVLNTSPVIIPRVSRAHASKRYPIPFDIHPLLVKMGWEFIDDIVWLKPEAAVKNRNGGFAQHRKPLAYKPNAVTEYLMVYRKKTQRLIDWNIRQYSAPAVRKSLVKGAYDSGNVWRVDPAFDKTHSAVFPAKLCEKVIRYYSMAEDLVFDPFGGSGTLGLTASYLDRYFFMTELSRQYAERMAERFYRHRKFFFSAPRFVSLEEFKKMKREHGGG